jgi:hypothetical protein
MSSIQRAKELLAVATQEVKASNEDGAWRDSHEVGKEMIAQQRAQERVRERAEDFLAWAISAAEAMEGDNPYVWDDLLHGFEQLFGEDT